MTKCDKAEFLVSTPLHEFPSFLLEILGNSSSEAKALYASNETKLTPFQFRLNLRSIVTKVQRGRFEILTNNNLFKKEPETLMHPFYECEILILFGITLAIGFLQDCASILYLINSNTVWF